MHYYITVIEFVFAILTEKDRFFKSFHKIVDGVLDSNRLDYIVRDQNSSVEWGKIPYERIINSAKLFYLERIIMRKYFKKIRDLLLLHIFKKLQTTLKIYIKTRIVFYMMRSFH